jgi:chemotaxis protein methyltransferase CheR
MMPQPGTADIDAIEVQLLLEAIYRRYGFDFRDYTYAFMQRRICDMIRAERLATASELQGQLLHDPACMERFLLRVTVHVTSMFRDPSFYFVFRTRVVPLLRDYSFVRIWHVGCSTGEEVYSMAILLQEERLYARCRLYATDMNEAVLAKAKAGIFPLASIQEYTGNYLKAGGTSCFSEYYTARYGDVIFQRSLRDNVVFSQHNLVTDGSFNEFHIILCRNVMIYFNNALTTRVHHLLYESLMVGGLLGLGSHECMKFTPYENDYEEFDGNERLYRRIV